mmetsp:Transcript_29655/g.49164  ORF Transcript_29655/g.49164 Transcript_29655/m.49164 type:complete len:126 (+) Transcript_29655:604-981(+)
MVCRDGAVVLSEAASAGRTAGPNALDNAMATAKRKEHTFVLNVLSKSVLVEEEDLRVFIVLFVDLNRPRNCLILSTRSALNLRLSVPKTEYFWLRLEPNKKAYGGTSLSPRAVFVVGRLVLGMKR